MNQTNGIRIFLKLSNKQFTQPMTQFDSKLIAQARKTKGYLQKKSSSTFSTWKLKYFIFLDDSLCVFKDQTLQSVQKYLSFSDILSVQPLESLLIQIKTAKKIYFLKAESPANQDLWIASINILKENHSEQGKSPKKSWSYSQSLEKRVSSSFKSIQTTQRTQTQKSSGLVFPSEKKITYLLRGKQLNKFLNLLNMDKLSIVTNEERFLSRILFIEDKKNGIFFSLSSKSIYPIIDGELVKEDLIYPYQLNVLYFLPINSYKSALEGKSKSPSLTQICKCSEILECVILNSSFIRLQIHCQKPVDIEVKHLPQNFVSNLQQCIRRLIDVGKEYWNPKGKLLKNIDQFIHKYIQNNENQIVLYKMIEDQFKLGLKININQATQKKQIQLYFMKFDSVVSNLKNFIDACEIKVNPVDEIKSKFVKLYHKFVYNFLNQNWNYIYKISSDQDLIVYSKKVFSYYQVLTSIHHDSRVKDGCKTLLKIALKNFQNSINQLINNFTNIEEQSLRILKKVQFEKDKETVSEFIFFSTYCTNFLSILSTQFRYLAQIPKFDEFVRMAWISMQQISKYTFQKLSEIAELCRQKTSLISITNSLKHMKNKRLPQIFSELEKTLMFSYKKQKEDFQKQITYEIGLVETFCVKKLFVITFSSINKDLLKLDIKNMDFQKICSIVIDEISKFEHILPQVRVAMYEAAFEEVCYFFYICIVKFDNKLLTKDQCLSMVNQKMTSIKDCFLATVDQEKIINLLKDLNLLKQFITCPINNIKMVTKELKKVFGSNFTELNLKNIISLRVSSLKEKQFIFEQCRQEIKSSYNSTEEIERESFFNGSIRRERVSTLTESLMSYCEQLQKVDQKTKRQRTILFGGQDSLREGTMCRKKMIKNFDTNYKIFFYRLKKGKLYEYDNEGSEDILNCYLLSQLKKCFIEPDRNQCINLEFQKEAIKLRCVQPEDASDWVHKILEAMEGTKTLISDLNPAEYQEEGVVLFQDLSKHKTVETKQTQEASSPKQKQKVRYMKKESEEVKGVRTSPKKTLALSPNNSKKRSSPTKQKAYHDSSRNMNRKAGHSKGKKENGGCGAGCNLF